MNPWRTIKSLAQGLPFARPAADGCAECPPDGLPARDPKFSAAVTALGAKLAKADGMADDGEFAAFSEVFQAVPAAARDVRRLYGFARQTTRGYESYARQIARRYRGCPGVLEGVLNGLYHIAKADGAVTAAEIAFIERVGEVFGLSPLTLRRIKAAHLGLPADDPYAVLDVAPDAPDEDVRKAWKRALLDAHPDKVVSRGLGADYIEFAQQRAAAINAAFDRVMRERHELIAAGAV